MFAILISIMLASVSAFQMPLLTNSVFRVSQSTIPMSSKINFKTSLNMIPFESILKQFSEKDIETAKRILEESFSKKSCCAPNANSEEVVKERNEEKEENNKCNNKILPVDLQEFSNCYEIFADIPGVLKNSTKVEVKDHILTIQAERIPVSLNLNTPDNTENNLLRHRSERFMGLLKRAIRLPEDANESLIKATNTDGVLRIEIPKHPEPEWKKIKVIQIE